jgi:hypothetical protein
VALAPSQQVAVVDRAAPYPADLKPATVSRSTSGACSDI